MRVLGGNNRIIENDGIISCVKCECLYLTSTLLHLISCDNLAKPKPHHIIDNSVHFLNE